MRIGPDVKRWLGLCTLLAAIAAITAGYWRHQYFLPEHRFMRIHHGMTVDEVRDIMGRVEDFPHPGEEDKLRLRWWEAEDRDYLTVSFDQEGRVVGKRITRSPLSRKPPYQD